MGSGFEDDLFREREMLGEAPIFKVNLEPTACRFRHSGMLALATMGEFGDLHPSSDGKTLFATKMTVRQPGEIVRVASGSSIRHPRGR